MKTAVDAFILARLRKAGLKPALTADRATLLRRITFDLIGLPPTPQEIDTFVADKPSTAWEKVVDRFARLAPLRRAMGRHWLDVVRFAESDGYEYDSTGPMPGAIAITSSRASTTTSPTMRLWTSNSPAMRWIRQSAGIIERADFQ